MSERTARKSADSTVRSLAQLLEKQPPTPPCLVEPGLLPAQGILFIGGEPKVGKSLLVANLALSRAAGHLLSAPQGLQHFVTAAQAAAAEVIILDPLYSTHDKDENDTRAMAALCQALLRLRDASGAALIVVHHVRKSINRHEIGSAFRGSSALHAVGDSYLLLTRPSPQLSNLELRFQFRYAAPQPPRLLELNPHTLWFSSAGPSPNKTTPSRKVETTDVSQALASRGGQLRYNQLREEIMQRSKCSKRTAQLAITEASQQGLILQDDGQYRLPL